MSILRTRAILKERNNSGDICLLNSKNKVLLYGESGKSTIALSYGMDKVRPVYVLTAAGGSHALQEHFPTAMIDSINNLDHLREIIGELESEYATVLTLRECILTNQQERLEKAKAIYKEFPIAYDLNGNPTEVVDIWDKMYDAALKQELPICSLVVEEINIIAKWIYDEVAETLRLADQQKVVGQDKSQRGFDWNIYEKEVSDMFTRILKLPTMVVFATADKAPIEQQNSNQYQPDICSGKANRKLIQMIGNVFYVFKKDGKHMIQLVEDKNVFAKDKMTSPFSNSGLEKELDLTGRPNYLWEYLADKNKSVK